MVPVDLAIMLFTELGRFLQQVIVSPEKVIIHVGVVATNIDVFWLALKTGCIEFFPEINLTLIFHTQITMLNKQFHM